MSFPLHSERFGLEQMFKFLLKKCNAIYCLKSWFYCWPHFYIIYSLVGFNVNCTHLLFIWIYHRD